MRIGSALGVLGLLASSALATTVISDQAFLLEHWDLVNLGGANVTSMSEHRVAGDGVTGDARRINVQGNGSITYRAENFKTDFEWTPGEDGAIVSIAWEIWYRFRSPSEFAAMEIIARQGESVYAAASTYREPQNQSSFWQRHTGSFAADAFYKIHGPGPQTLDFTPGAEPIQFGYACFSPVFIPAPASHWASFFVLTIESRALADLNADGIVNVQDLIMFLEAFQAGGPLGDFDGNGTVDVQDLTTFLAAFNEA